MQIIIAGKGVTLTSAIEEYVNKKLGGLEKFFDGIIRVDVVLGEDNRRHVKGNTFFAEGKLEVPGNDVFVKKEAKGLYEAIDDLKAGLEHELKKYKIKLAGNVKKNRNLARNNKEYNENEE